MGTPQVAKKLGITESQVGHVFDNASMLVFTYLSLRSGAILTLYER